jgi:hypothetical protein
MEEFKFNAKNLEFTFNFDVTFEFEYEPCSIKIPVTYPNGTYMIKKGKEGKYKEYSNSGDNFYQTLKNVFDELYETRMVFF